MSAEQEILFRHCRLDTVNQLLWRGSRVIPLRQKSFAVLRYLLEHAGQLAIKEELLRAVWPETYVSDIVLKVCIRELRHALGDQREAPQFIETVHRRGYRFIAPLTSARPVSGSRFQVSGQKSVDSSQLSVGSRQKLETRNVKPETHVVGREAELAQFHRWLEKALSGERQVVFVTGEPGVGKTTLVEAFLDHAVVNPTLWTARGQCIEHYGAGEAYLPVLEALERLCRTPGRERLITLLSQYVPMWLAQMPALVGPTERKRLLREIPGAPRERMLRAIAETVEALTAETPLILVLEDLHWSDYATLDLLSFLARRREPARLLLIGTYRPGEMLDHSHPLKAIKYELQAHGQCGELALSCLTPAAVSTYMTARFGGGTRLPLPQLAALIHQRTDGNPLFLITVVDYLLAQGLIGQRDGRWELRGDLAANEIGVPASIQEMIETQSARLSPEEQRVLEVASVAGVEFSAATVAAGLAAEVPEVEERCVGLVRRAQFLRARGVSEWPDGTVAARYEFIHSLYQQAWYERVTAGRRVQLHRRIGERAEVAYGSRASEVAAELAMHFERGRDYRRAIQYRLYAAENALRRGGYLEAVKHLTSGLERLPTLPDTSERLQQEISLRISLGLSLVATKGCAAPEVEKNYSRALELCRQVEATPQLYWALWGLQGFYYVGAELPTARALGEQLFALAQRLQDPGLLGVAHSVLGTTLSSLGEPLLARAHLEQGIALCSAQRHARLQAICLSFTGRVLWTLGYPDQARQRIQEALTLAHELAHPLTSVVTACIAALLHTARGEVQAAQERAEEAMALAVERGFIYWEAQAIALRGWALAQQGRGKESVAQIRQGLAAYQETGAQLARPLLLGLLAETYSNTGRPEEGLTVATEALALAQHTGQRSQEAWLSWLRGELLLQAKVRSPKSEIKASRESRQVKTSQDKSEVASPQHPAPSTQVEAEACFQRALDLARGQSAKALELRTAMSLSRLWHQQGKKDKARQMLAEIYSWFTEGFDTADLQEAKVLLEELGGKA
jgi:DNA-binding winged helix-turn-helix (wHTH) protein/tetratricopeptide (TPR) repeat protein